MKMPIRQNIQLGFMQIKVILKHSDLQRMYKAIHRVNNAATIQAKENPYRNAVAFRNLLLLNINSQKHMGGYAPYNKKYREWKKEKVGHSYFWKLFGHLIKNLTVFPVGSGYGRMNKWMSGITPGVMDKGGTSMYGSKGGRPVLISAYGRWMEFGRRGQPARPIFGPTTEEYSMGRWLRIGKNSIFTVRRAWR